jgi:hypothetical protein
VLTESETVTVSIPGEFVSVPLVKASSAGSALGAKRDSSSPMPAAVNSAADTQERVENPSSSSATKLRARTKSSIGDIGDDSSSSSSDGSEDEDDDIAQLLESKGWLQSRRDGGTNSADEGKGKIEKKKKKSSKPKNKSKEEDEEDPVDGNMINDESSSDEDGSDDDILKKASARKGSNRSPSPVAIRGYRADSTGGDLNDFDESIWRDAPGEGDDSLPEAVLIAPRSPPASPSGRLSRVVSEDPVEEGHARGLSAPIPSPRDIQVLFLFFPPVCIPH